MNKSPINVLQETLIKEGCLPSYSYGLNVSDFKCEVTCKNLSATGIGNTKKEAKHNAAINMLSLLNIINPKELKTKNNIQDLNIHEPACSNELNNANISPSLKTQMFPEYNYIGLLQELCIQCHLDLPLYELVQQTGPSHMRTFQIKCNVGSYEMVGIAFCKKTAKQEAAKNILDYLITLNILPKDASKKIESYKKKVYNSSQDRTIGKSSIQITKPVLSVKISEITEIPEEALATYVEPNSNNIAIQSVIDDSSTALINNNNNTIKNTQISIYQSKSIETVNNCKQTLNNNCKKLDVDNSIIESAFTKSLKSTQSDYIEFKTDATKEQNIVTQNSEANLLLVLINKDKEHKLRTIEDDLREFNIEITDPDETNKTLDPLTELSRKVLSTYIAPEDMGDSRKSKSTNECLTDVHNLFKRTYSNRISNNLKERMNFVSKLSICKSNLKSIQEVFQDVNKALGVNFKQTNVANYTSDGKNVTIICLRVLTSPVIAQMGLGETENESKAQAMFAIINTILEYIK